MYFHPVRFGLALGIANALFLLALGIVSGFFNYGNEWVRVLRSVYIGYNATLFGVLFGMLWGLLLGLVLGWLFSVIFNFFAYLDESEDYE